MIKSIIKELIILLLLCLAILLVLGVLFYDRIPTTKVIPEKIEYKTSDAVKEELQNDAVDYNDSSTITYKIEDSDLRIYQSEGSYNKGKVNPFADPGTTGNSNTNEQEETNNTGGGTTTNPNTNNNTSTTNNSVNSNSVGNFFDKPGNK